MRTAHLWKLGEDCGDVTLCMHPCQQQDAGQGRSMICSSKPSFSDGLYEKERLFFSLCCGKSPQGQLLVCSLDRAMDFQGSLPSKQTAEFHFITSATGWSLNRAGEGAPPSPHLCSALYLMQPTCGTGGDLGGEQLDSIFR